MSLKSVTQLNVDFCNKKYISINAKQNDKESRFLEITCYDQGKLFPINNAEHFAYVRYKKADGYGVFNECEIKSGRILVELTEQMLAAEGVCYADLVIVNKGSVEIDCDTGEITFINNTGILSTMTFCINVFETAIENSEFESTYEFDNLNRLLDRANADYQDVITTSRGWAKTSESWAVGGTGTRSGENVDNAKYYANSAGSYKDSANNSATKAAASEAAALSSEQKASKSEAAALTSERNAKTSENIASNSASSASASAENAKASETAAKGYSMTAQDSMSSAYNSAIDAHESASNAYEHYLQVEAITNGLNGAFLPMGTISYSELDILKGKDVVGAGYLYNIKDNFITDDTFKMGAGIEYPAGTNVYYTADGYWDCLTGTTVTGIKGVNESIYRKGNVELTAENVGAVSYADIADVDEVKIYLGI